jgi:hypothetical protein
MVNQLVYKTKKAAVAALNQHANPKGLYTMKLCDGESSTISYLKCQDGLEGGPCSWCARIRTSRETVKGNRVRQFKISLVDGNHNNCGSAALLEASTPPLKKAKPSEPLSSRQDWSTPENKAKMTSAMFECSPENPGKKLTQAQAAAKYSIPPAVLCKTIKGRRSLDTKKGCGTVIHRDVEEALVMYCLQMSDAASGITPTEIGWIAKAAMHYLQPQNTTFCASSTWVTGFISRHQQIAKRRAQALERNRASGLNEDIVEDYFVVLAGAIKHCEDNSPSRSLPPNFRLNLDESAAIQQAQGKLVLGRFGASSIHTVCEGVRSVNCRMSQVAMISAGDARFHPSYIIEGVEEPTAEIQPDGSLRNLPAECKWTMSPKGTLTDEIWEEMVVPDIIDQIEKLRVKEQLPGQWALLTLDGFTSHSYCHKSLVAFLEAKIMVVRIPSHSSHALQALDVTVFHPLKVDLRESITLLQHDSLDTLTKWDLLRLFHKSWDKVSEHFHIC